MNNKAKRNPVLVYVLLVNFVIGVGAMTIIRGYFSQIHVYAKEFGNTYDEQYEELKTQEQKKAELEAKIASLQNQEQTLANQISYLESQISLTLLQQDDTRTQIGETQELLEDVNTNIEDLTLWLENLDGSIQDLYDVLALRIRTSYELEKSNTGVGLIFDNRSLKKTILELAYLRSLQKEDNRLLSQMNETRGEYQEQKTQLQDLKEEKEELKANLEVQNRVLGQQKIDLSDQQSSKAWLLQITQGEEEKYQGVLLQIEREIESIKLALVSTGTLIGEVSQGDVVGHLGNTGCSTGPHLHFGYYVNGVAVDPLSKLNSSEFVWPVGDPDVTQWFGENYTWYMSIFGLPGHNGIDMVDATLGYGAPILAVKEGTATRVSDPRSCDCPYNYCTGTVGKGVRIDHDDGTKTIYWHLQ